MKEGTIYSGEVYLLLLRREKHGNIVFNTQEKSSLKDIDFVNNTVMEFI